MRLVSVHRPTGSTSARGSSSDRRRCWPIRCRAHRQLVVRLRQRHPRPLRPADRHRHLPGVRLRAVGRPGLREPGIPELRGAPRLVPARRALLGLERHGRRDDAAHDPGLPVRGLQVPARADVGRRRVPLPVHPGHGLHRPDPALGSGRLLGARDRRRRSLARAPFIGAAVVALLLGGPIIAGRTLSRFFSAARVRDPRDADRAWSACISGWCSGSASTSGRCRVGWSIARPIASATRRRSRRTACRSSRSRRART